MTLRDALAFLCQREIARKDQRRIDMSSLAKFPYVRDLAGFDYAAQPSIDRAQIRDLATGRFIARRCAPAARASGVGYRRQQRSNGARMSMPVRGE